jgi:hypothetical protein
MPLIHDVMPHFAAIMEAVARIDMRDAIAKVKAFDSHVEQLAAIDGEPCLLSMAPNLRLSPMPIPVETLTRLKQIDPDGDVLAPFRVAAEPESTVPPPMADYYQQRIGRGIGLLDVWFRDTGASRQFHDAARRLVQQDDGAEPTITGLAVVGANAISLAASAMGTEPTAILDHFRCYEPTATVDES